MPGSSEGGVVLSLCFSDLDSYLRFYEEQYQPSSAGCCDSGCPLGAIAMTSACVL